MTTDFDKEIVKAAEEMVSAFGQDGPWKPLLVDALLKAIAAKREALRPKLLTAKEAQKVWGREANAGKAPFPAIVAAAHARALAVIEALPVENISHMGSPVVHWVKREDIRRALGVQP